MRKVKIVRIQEGGELFMTRQCSVCRDCWIDFDCFLEENNYQLDEREAKKLFLDPYAQIICTDYCDDLLQRIQEGGYKFEFNEFDLYIKEIERRQFWWLVDLGLISREVKPK